MYTSKYMRITFTKHIDDIAKDTGVALVSIESGEKVMIFKIQKVT